MSDREILVGTSKGLVIIRRSPQGWRIENVQHLGFPVSMIHREPSNGKLWCGLAHRHWGPKLHWSADDGQSWNEAPTPSFGGAELKAGVKAGLKSIWTMQSTLKNDGLKLWLGVEPGALFTSSDGNEFTLVESLWNHPGRQDEKQWFGAGRNLPFIHSIVVDPRDNEHMYIAVSAAGIFESLDGGRSWEAANEGMVSYFLPDPYARVGHDPHILLQCRNHPDTLWQQSHSGVFRSTDGARTWKDVSPGGDIPRYGFAMAIDDDDPNRAWIIPAASDDMRIAPGLALQVFYTTDGGQTWSGSSSGLPEAFAFDIVLRQAFVRSGSVMVFGTNNGNVYLSENDGREWVQICQHLAKINIVQLN